MNHYFSNKIFAFLFLLSILDLFNCLNIENETDDYKYLDYDSYIRIDRQNFTQEDIRLFMYVKEINSSKIYFNVYVTDPTSVTFSYQFFDQINPEETKFQDLEAYITTNNGNSHTISYKLSKPKDIYTILYIKITPHFFDKGIITIESTSSIVDVYLILGLIVGGFTLIALIAIFLSMYSIFKTERDKTIVESNEDVIIEKVNPEDFSTLT